MDKDIKKMKKLVDFMRKQGVLTLKTPEMQLILSPAALFPEKQTEPVEEKKITEREFTEEEVALWSSPGQTEVQ